MEINSVLDALRKKDYEFVSKHLDILLKDGIRENYLNEYNSLAVMLTKLKRFEDTINLYTELKRKDIESLTLVSCALISTFTTDLYKALSIINNSKILNSELNKYLEIGGANYNNLLIENEEVQLAFILSNFIKELGKCENDMIVIKYYELISLLYEIGYSESIIDKLTKIGYILFNQGEEK